MDWTACIRQAIAYMEEHMKEDISMTALSREIGVSSYYFQKGFSMLCGMTVGEYLRCRRLSLAGRDLVLSESKIIDIALDYGYDSPDSFTKAFSRFHGITPLAARREGGPLRTFAPLQIKISLEGGSQMDYKIVKKAPFTVKCVAKRFACQNALTEVPLFWQEHHQNGGGKIRGMYGINIDEAMGGDTFEYLIADDYNPAEELPVGCETRTIPALTWAVFPCHGPMPESIQAVEKQIFAQWLPNNGYQFSAGYNIERYDDPRQYEKGTRDEKYYCEAWIPVKESE